ncbi:MAG: MBL fold metallo-hydrolase [Bacteroidota bacterium]
MRRSKLTVLGCGDAFASGGRFCTSFLLESEGTSLLMDCGVSALIRLRQLQLDINDLSVIAISHFHGDHFGGLPFLFLAMKFDLQREAPLQVVGPPGIRDKVYQLQEAMYPDTSFVIDELDVEFVEFGAEWTKIGPFDIQAFPVSHAPSSNPHGMRLRWQEKILAFSGDTEWDDRLVDIAKDAELMICECNWYDKPGPGHLDYLTLSQKAHLFETKRLVLTHLGREMQHREIGLEQLEDGQVIDLW